MRTVLMVTAVALALVSFPLNVPSAGAHGHHRQQVEAVRGELHTSDPVATTSGISAGERYCSIHQTFVPIESALPGHYWFNKFYVRAAMCFDEDDDQPGGGRPNLLSFTPTAWDVPRSVTHWNLVEKEVQALEVFPHRGYYRVKATYELCIPFFGLELFCQRQIIWISASVSDWRYFEATGSYYADFYKGGRRE